MIAKIKEKEEAIRLRKLGFSLNEISQALGVSKSSASLWVGSMLMSKKAQSIIKRKRQEAYERSAATHHAHTRKKISNARNYGNAVLSRAHFNHDALRVLCALLYWCEGVKIRQKSLFGFTNSDPLLVSSFMKLLREEFIVDETKFRVTVHVHEYHNHEKQLRFWSKVTSIPLSQFNKPYRKPHTAIRTREGYQGCVSVRYMNVDFARRLEGIAIAFLEKNGPIG